MNEDHGNHYHPEPEPDSHSPERDAFGPAAARGVRTGADGGSEVRRLAQPVVVALGMLLRHLHWPLLLLTLLYLGSGITFVGEGERALVLRWGKLVGDSPTTQVHEPGLLLAWPAPIDRVLRVPTERISQVEVDALDLTDERWEEINFIFRQMQANPGDAPDLPESIDPEREGYLLTGDRGIVQSRFDVRFRVGDPVAFALREANPDALITAAVQSAAVEVGASLSMDDLLGDQRSRFQSFVQSRAQATLVEMNSGLRIESLVLTALAPPPAITPSIWDVEDAKTEARTELQDAEAYARAEIARAKGVAAEVLGTARTAARQELAEARAFHSLLESFGDLDEDRRRVTLARLQEETFQEILLRASERVRRFAPTFGDSSGDFRITLTPDDLGLSSSNE